MRMGPSVPVVAGALGAEPCARGAGQIPFSRFCSCLNPWGTDFPCCTGVQGRLSVILAH